ncbi:unnamed protein product [Trichobilharzia szidati]|nr:unnamed protein product [Trichobilharzia szidati]
MWFMHHSTIYNKYQLLLLLLTLITLLHILSNLHVIVALNFKEQVLRDSEMLKVLSTLKGIPKNMSKHELFEIRKNIPKFVENWITFINNEQLLLDYTYGKISKHAFDDLRKSIVFLRIAPCKINSEKHYKVCFSFHPSSIIPKHTIQSATISTYLQPWINPNRLKLHVFLMNSYRKIYEHFYINLNNNNNNDTGTSENLVFEQIQSPHRQVTWDISVMMRNLQQSKYHLIHSFIMTLENSESDPNLNFIDAADQSISFLTKDGDENDSALSDTYNEIDDVFKKVNINDDGDDEPDRDDDYGTNDEVNNQDNDNTKRVNNNNNNVEETTDRNELFIINDSDDFKLHKSLDINDKILSENAQIILNMKTPEMLQLERHYLSRKRLTPRSFLADSTGHSFQPQSCPSFLDRGQYETKCCLFRYTLNKLQMDENDKLRFIIFPHHLPLNMCHGRCIGLYIPTDNAHSILMNRYFSGLRSVEREAIYNSMPCCAANETIPFTILYKDHNEQLVTETLPTAVITNCACR